MKKLNSFFLMGSVALAGLGVMSSCSSDDLGTDSTNITDNKAVKTQFALNIPRANGGTRMSAENTQGESSSTFLGMEDIKLYSFSEEPGAGKTSTSLIELAKLGISEISSTTSSKIYNDVAIPVGTTHFLFYGHAPQGTEEVTNAANFTKGVLTFTSNDAVDNIKAKLVQLKGTDETSETALKNLLNGVITVEKWKTQPAETELCKLYNQFTKLKAGSANSIRLALQSLYNNVGSIVSSTDEGTKTIAKAIRSKIEESFSANIQPDNSYTLVYKPTFKGNKNYPNNINLPDGAVQVTFDEPSSEFSYNSNSSLTGLNGLDASNICFPSSIYYFCSSDLAATADELKAWPQTTAKWTSGSDAPWLNADGQTLKKGWTEEVLATTRSIAMRQNINYGVASLKTTVKCDKARLDDNKKLALADVIHNKEFTGFVDVPAGGFKVTGLLIGGQPTEVGFNFLPKKPSEFTYTIYDKVNIKAKTNGSNANYTIVLPNDKGREETTQEKVNVAIELTNDSGTDFRGTDGIVPNGGKFYLVGKLEPKPNGLAGVENPAVFMSDYQTTLSLNIKSLAGAYNTIPDLRSTKLQFGMSVDLEWQQGLQFDIDIP